MVRNQDIKQKARDRAARTGESYSAALHNIKPTEAVASEPSHPQVLVVGNPTRKAIWGAIASRQNILVAGLTGSGKHAALATIVKESDQDHPRFVFSGEVVSRHLDGTPSMAVRAPGLLKAIHESGLPMAAEVQARTEDEAYERFAASSGLTPAVVKSLFPVVVLVDGETGR